MTIIKAVKSSAPGNMRIANRILGGSIKGIDHFKKIVVDWRVIICIAL